MVKNWYKKGDALLREIRDYSVPESDLSAREAAFWYLGQCGFLLKQKKTLLIDAVLNDLTDSSGNTRRYYGIPFSPSLLSVDYVLCTHAHADHMALGGLSALAASNPNAIFLVPEDCIRPMTDAGIPAGQIREARAGVPVTLEDDLSVFPVCAAHPVHSKLPDGGDTALSYFIRMGNISFLHMGDTYLTARLLTDLSAQPAPDVMFTPINGGDFFRTARNCIGNLNARESAALSRQLQADLTIPTHYDMVMGNTVDPLDFVRELGAMDSAAKWALPALGERIIYRK